MKNQFRPRRWPAVVLGVTMTAAALGTLAPPITSAQAYSVQPGGYAQLVSRVSPAVVYIEVTKTAEPAAMKPADLPPEFQEFARRFGMPLPDQPFDAPRGQLQQTGVGTGFIISAQGDIVTNNHVVEGADKVTVKLADGTSMEGKVVGTDPATDLALVRVSAGHDLPFVEWGDSTSLQVGQDVVAIGNPFGLGNTVTAGIVSALGRDINSGPFDNYIQTDAAINQGNSGGPLFDSQGKVMGINTAIFSPSGGSIGIGFAVPAETARQVIADLADDGKVERGWLGVSIQPVTEDIAAAIGMEKATGALIADVSADTPAAKAGLKRGDVVTAVNGTPVQGPRDLTRIVAGARPDSKVDLDLLRAGKPTSIVVTLGERAAQPA
ncbi:MULTISPECIES: Do family serine endopeptidase [unclassified Paracoccus (in: a-proteobacteria)]|uniref:Do family serine endopeptidase n=1 Tax=unclassified Paracoccus (in: a-proteobacteria) TaxID=2688777 RepID=UPI0012B1FE30|nr:MULTISPECIES: Do family serine endopeptidase [unclassified Paracoccus (in: a-proteobacteria)]UXU74414.1 Do family serine endopeptidase [Paracoccus sp. SMMA_5]UXU80304.1 Do family serine endopeptidase [Paracoccus sp. SMMA_5_TC]